MSQSESTRQPRKKKRGRRVRWFWLLPGVFLILLRIFYPEVSRNWAGLISSLEMMVVAPGAMKVESAVILAASRAQEALDAGNPKKAVEILDAIGPTALQYGNWPARMYVLAYLAQDNIEQALNYYHLFSQNEVPEDLQKLMRPYQERYLAKTRGTSLQLEDVTSQSGAVFQHFQCGKHRLEELHQAYGSGVALVDFDNDGLLDIFYAGGMGQPAKGEPANRLYRNLGEMKFEDVTQGSGLEYTGFSRGVCCVDLDGDGLPEVYVGNHGPNRLYRNLGGMKFEDSTGSSGLAGDGGMTMAVGSADYDGDGDLDFYVVNWASALPNTEGFLPNLVYGHLSRRSLFSPYSHKAEPNQLFRNNGNGTFIDVTAQAGVTDAEGRGLGMAFWDFNHDGFPDLFIANDMTPNRFYLNRGDGTFEDLSTNVRLYDSRAGMGVSVTDLNGDDWFDIFYTNYKTEYNAAVINRLKDHGDFSEQTEELNLRSGTLGVTSWGTAFSDLDNDRDFDLAIVNGLPEPYDLESREPNPMRCLLEPQLVYENQDGKFHEVTAMSGALGSLLEVGRGLVQGDVDRDGREDLVMTTNNGPAYVLKNTCRQPRHWLVVQPRWKAPNRLAIGSWVTLEAEGLTQRRAILSGASFLSQNPFEVHFGLGEVAAVEKLTVHWPDRTATILEHVPADQVILVDWERR